LPLYAGWDASPDSRSGLVFARFGSGVDSINGRDAHVDRRALQRARINAQPPSHHRGSFFHAHEAHTTASPAHFGKIEPTPIVFDGQNNGLRRPFNREVDSASVSV
jgi:hypothetical protein